MKTNEIMRNNILHLIFILLISSAVSSQDTFITQTKSKKWGLVNLDGTTIVEFERGDKPIITSEKNILLQKKYSGFYSINRLSGAKKKLNLNNYEVLSQNGEISKDGEFVYLKDRFAKNPYKFIKVDASGDQVSIIISEYEVSEIKNNSAILIGRENPLIANIIEDSLQILQLDTIIKPEYITRIFPYSNNVAIVETYHKTFTKNKNHYFLINRKGNVVKDLSSDNPQIIKANQIGNFNYIITGHKTQIKKYNKTKNAKITDEELDAPQPMATNMVDVHVLDSIGNYSLSFDKVITSDYYFQSAFDDVLEIRNCRSDKIQHPWLYLLPDMSIKYRKEYCLRCSYEMQDKPPKYHTDFEVVDYLKKVNIYDSSTNELFKTIDFSNYSMVRLLDNEKILLSNMTGSRKLINYQTDEILFEY